MAQRVTAGSGSRVAAAARAAHSEAQRLAFVTHLFGADVAAHWAPKNAADVILDVQADDAESDRILHDTAGKYTDAQKRRALYLFLARNQPTDEQQLWLSGVAEALVQ